MPSRPALSLHNFPSSLAMEGRRSSLCVVGLVPTVSIGPSSIVVCSPSVHRAYSSVCPFGSAVSRSGSRCGGCESRSSVAPCSAEMVQTESPSALLSVASSPALEGGDGWRFPLCSLVSTMVVVDCIFCLYLSNRPSVSLCLRHYPASWTFQRHSARHSFRIPASSDHLSLSVHFAHFIPFLKSAAAEFPPRW